MVVELVDEETSVDVAEVADVEATLDVGEVVGDDVPPPPQAAMNTRAQTTANGHTIASSHYRGR